MVFTERLKQARIACGFTQQQIADILAIDRSTYAYYELGTLTPAPDILKMLASIFRTEKEWLVASENDIVCWSAPDTHMKLKHSINERRMSDLSKDERSLIALYRIALNNGNEEQLFRILSDSAMKHNEQYAATDNGSIIIDQDFDDDIDLEAYEKFVSEHT